VGHGSLSVAVIGASRFQRSRNEIQQGGQHRFSLAKLASQRHAEQSEAAATHHRENLAIVADATKRNVWAMFVAAGIGAAATLIAGALGALLLGG
jgi:hypothetical protein